MRGLVRLRGAGLLVGGVALGVGLAVGIPSLVSTSGEATAGGRSADVDPASLLDPSRVAEVDGGRERTETAREAVEQFLDAARADDRDRSFALLADPVRVDYGSVRAWAADPDALGEVLGFDVEASAADEGGARTVTTLTRYRSSLDSVAGLVPARARTSWAVVLEDGGWAVDLDATTQVPLLPPDEAAVEAASEWAQRQQACPAQPEPLQGQPALAASLCRTTGKVETAGEALALSSLDAGVLQNGLGSDVGSWARQVDIASPVALRAVLAPLDDVWTVVAVLAPPGSGR